LILYATDPTSVLISLDNSMAMAASMEQHVRLVMAKQPLWSLVVLLLSLCRAADPSAGVASVVMQMTMMARARAKVGSEKRLIYMFSQLFRRVMCYLLKRPTAFIS